METEEIIGPLLERLGLKSTTTYVKRNESFEPTGDYFVTCDVGLFVGQVTRNPAGVRTLTGKIVPWPSVRGVDVRIVGFLSDDKGPHEVTVKVEEPEFDAEWRLDQRMASRTDRDELAAFAVEVLRKTG